MEGAIKRNTGDTRVVIFLRLVFQFSRRGEGGEEAAAAKRNSGTDASRAPLIRKIHGEVKKLPNAEGKFRKLLENSSSILAVSASLGATSFPRHFPVTCGKPRRRRVSEFSRSRFLPERPSSVSAFLPRPARFRGSSATRVHNWKRHTPPPYYPPSPSVGCGKALLAPWVPQLNSQAFQLIYRLGRGATLPRAPPHSHPRARVCQVVAFPVLRALSLSLGLSFLPSRCFSRRRYRSQMRARRREL